MQQSDEVLNKPPEETGEQAPKDEQDWQQPSPRSEPPRRREEIKVTKKGTIFRAAGLIGLVAGIDLIASGYTSHYFLATILADTQFYAGSFLPSSIQSAINLALAALNFLVAVGGGIVIAGAVLLLLKHGFFGRLLIRIGGGMGIFGLLFAMGEAYYVSGYSTVIFHGEYWTGVILATVAIWLSRRA